MTKIMLIALAIAGCRSTPAPPRTGDARLSDPWAPAPNPTYAIHVVDEAGKPLEGVRVYAARTVMLEGYGDVAGNTELIGIELTDRRGDAVFDIPQVLHGMLTSVIHKELWAVGERPGWPLQAANHNTIVLGPPRSVSGTIALRKPCDAAPAEVSLSPLWDSGAKGVPEAPTRWITTRADGTFTLDDLGPGPYNIQVHATARPCRGSNVSADFRGSDAARTGIPVIDLPRVGWNPDPGP